jgi:uncharacterized protein (DUF1778 family)
MKKNKSGNKRTVQVNCLFKPKEKKLIEEAAAAANVTLSFLLRKSTIHNAERLLGKGIER